VLRQADARFDTTLTSVARRHADTAAETGCTWKIEHDE
jgi:hypothetical protein